MSAKVYTKKQQYSQAKLEQHGYSLSCGQDAQRFGMFPQNMFNNIRHPVTKKKIIKAM